MSENIKDGASGEPGNSVSLEDFKKLQSTYDKKLMESAKQIEAAQQALKAREDELNSLRATAPKDEVERAKREKTLAEREAKIAADAERIAQTAKQVKARELLAQYKVDLTIEDLMKCQSEVDMELLVLRKTVEPKSSVNVPKSGSVDIERGTAPVSGGNLRDALEAAKKKGRY